MAQSWASRREYANTWGDYTDIFNDLLYTFLTEFDRKMTRRIIFKNMKFNDFDGLHVSSLKVPPQSFLADLSNTSVTL